MKLGRTTTQLSLIIIGCVLILGTYFLYPIFLEKKIVKNKLVEEEFVTKSDEKNKFENVEYRGLYNIDNEFVIKSTNAHILNSDPDVVYMENVKVILQLKEKNNIIITSDKGIYNKVTYDIYFKQNVKAVDGKTVLLAENLDLMSNEDSASIYNKVVLNSENGTLNADRVDYDFDTKYYKITMFNDDKVKLKLIK